MIQKMNLYYGNNNISTTDFEVPFTPRRISKPKKMYAKALYDNLADTPEELTFKKGEILNVIEQDTEGLTGWWLCSLRGRQGICPGNRLRIMNSYDSGCFSLSPSSSPCQSLAASTATLNSSILSSDIYENTSVIGSSQQHLNQQGNNATSTPLTTNVYSRSSLQSSSYGQGNRRSWHVSPHKVITPQKCGDVYVYDLIPSPPPSATISSCNSSQLFTLPNETVNDYDVPKPPTPILSTQLSYDFPKSSWCRSSFTQHNDMSTPPSSLVSRYSHQNSLPQLQEESYDVPRSSPNLKVLRQLQQSNITPSSSNSSLHLSDSLGSSISSSNRSSFMNASDYDVPRRNPIPVKKPYPLPNSSYIRSSCPSPSPSTSSTSGLATYDFPSPNPKLVLNKIEIAPKELPLELQQAVETLDKLQNEAVTSITRLLSFVVPGWRTKDRIEPILMEIKLSVVRLRTAIHDLTEFGEGALGNASKADDRNLAIKLRPLVKSLKDADKLVRESADQIEYRGWTSDNLSKIDQRNKLPPDSLDRLLACVQSLVEDVRLLSSFIQGNAPLLFKRISLTAGPETPTSNGSHYSSNSVSSNSNTISSGSSEWVEDYDYVSFESKDLTAKKNLELKAVIPENLHKHFDKVVKIAENSAISGGGDKSSELNSNDKLLVKYYSAQIVTHMGYLNEAIDSFLNTVEKNQPPKFFIAYGKFVVLSAHNLVSIGDIVHRNISKTDLKVEVEKCTDELSDTLKDCVLKSKKAAQCFPSVTAVQEMVDSVVDISHLANDLKNLMLKVVLEEIIN